LGVYEELDGLLFQWDLDALIVAGHKGRLWSETRLAKGCVAISKGVEACA